MNTILFMFYRNPLRKALSSWACRREAALQLCLAGVHIRAPSALWHTVCPPAALAGGRGGPTPSHAESQGRGGEALAPAPQGRGHHHVPTHRNLTGIRDPGLS